VNNCISIDPARLRAAYEKARADLLAERTSDGHWVGELSSSALSTATAVSALAVTKAATSGRGSDVQTDELISRGVAWLVKQQNSDGGFGDTDLSHSNIATTYLVIAALHLAQRPVGNALRGVPGCDDNALQLLLDRANAYIATKGGLQGLRDRYGIDKTFVVPIMTNLALAGLVEWREIDTLPFELACVPQSWYRFVGMPVVSYAIPALVAIGQAQFHHAPPRNPISRLIRRLSITRSLSVLRRMQPNSGGYLEATPLTSFVVMSLASIPKPRPVVAVHKESVDVSALGQSSIDQNPQTATNGRGFAEEIIREGLKFLANSIRPDGSWPIDTNLATWNTTLAINALAGAGEDVAALLGPDCLNWLLSCQHTKPHPFTGATPGGFGWSDLSGAVPDSDDTPGALLALSNWPRLNLFEHPTIGDALLWLLTLQNRNGGWPTFCRGWGKLPFDRSGTDLTAHAIRALKVHQPRCVSMKVARRQGLVGRALEMVPNRIDQAIDQALAFLARRQNTDGSWSPLWFGNQDRPDEDNPVYGTAKVLMAYRDLGLMDAPEAQRGVAWLLANQNEDGGWGSGVWGKARSAESGARSGGQTQTSDWASIESHGEPVLSTQYSVLSTSTPTPSANPKSPIPNLQSSVEETALAVEALLAAVPSPEPRAPSPPPYAALEKGLDWLINRVENGQHRQPAPIGFYFAKLWYYERLYPLTFTVAALGRACRQFTSREFSTQPIAPPSDLPPETAPSDAQ
jgi:squalene-hopene/tetraprenyl-beta-curcumene cyclase